jgi:hypothetical protein
MKKIYTLLLMLMIFGLGLASCADFSDEIPADLNNDPSNVLQDQRYDPTNPPDSTYDPFK